MSAPMSVFLNSAMNLQAMVAAIERVLGVTLVRVEDDQYTRHEHCGVGHTMILIGDHELEDDLGIAFSAYEYQLDFVVSTSGARAADAEDLKYALAMYSFGKLTAALGCRAMVVYNLEEVIEHTASRYSEAS